MDLQSLSHLELRQICYFLTIVATENSFSRAAERLHIEQPPLSQRIRALEKRLDLQLFDRRRRPLQLTAAGRIFHTEVEKAIAQLDRAIIQAQRTEQGELGCLSVGIASSIANGILPQLIRAFCDRYSQVEIELRELTAEQQCQALSDRQLDVGLEVFSPSRLQTSGLEHQCLAQESLLAVVPATHRFAHEQQIPLQSLAAEPLILPSPEAFPFYGAFLEECVKAGFQPQLVQQTRATWMLTLLSLVAAGVGVAILPSNVLNVQRTGVVCCEIQDLSLKRQISMAWHPDNTSQTLGNFRQVVRQQVT